MFKVVAANPVAHHHQEGQLVHHHHPLLTAGLHHGSHNNNKSCRSGWIAGISAGHYPTTLTLQQGQVLVSKPGEFLLTWQSKQGVGSATSRCASTSIATSAAMPTTWMSAM